MQRPDLRTLASYAYALPAVLALAYAVRLVALFAARDAYPYDLEWMEGGMLAHAWRLQHGQPLYTAPSAEWIPFIYPPGYAALLALAGSAFGLTPLVGRLLSVAGTALAAASIAHVVGRHGRSPLIGALSAAVFLGTYPDGGAFFDLVRNEALGVGLLLCAIACTLDGRRGMAEAGGLVLACAFVVKHNLAAFGLPLLFAVWSRDGAPAALRFAAASMGPALLVTGVLQWRTDGRFLQYLLAAPASHGGEFTRAFPGTPWELARALPAVLIGGIVAGTTRRPVAVALAAGAAGVLLIERGPLGGLGLPRVAGIPQMGPLISALGMASVAGALAALVARWDAPKMTVEGRAVAQIAALSLVLAMTMRAHIGGFVNVHIPMFAAVATAGGLALARADGRLPGLAPLVFAVQLGYAHARLDARSLTPTAEDVATGDAIVERLRKVDGPILSPFAPWLPVLAGKEPSWHLISLWDVAEHPVGPFPGSGEVVSDALRRHRWAAVADAQRSMRYGIGVTYVRGEVLGGRGFLPRTGWRARPTVLMVPADK